VAGAAASQIAAPARREVLWGCGCMGVLLW
jgi:hypothetical protein